MEIWTMQRRGGRLLGFLVGLAALWAGAAEPFTFVQMCDPQFGLGGYKQDVLRFQQAVRQINALQPDFVVICGDLVNSAGIEGTLEDFASEKAAFRVPCYCAPGNHDGTVSPELLARYRRVIGPDYYEFEHKGHTLLVVNSELWMIDIPEESKKHDQWFKESLEKAASAKRPVIVVAHHPLYVNTPDEPGDAWNIPLEKRRELLESTEKRGVVAWLSGHIHKEAIHDYKGMQLVSSLTTSVPFFDRPFGFRVWHVGETRPYPHEFVPLDLSKMDAGIRISGTVRGLRKREDCVVVFLTGRHTPEAWTLESLMPMEKQSWVRETVEEGRFLVKGLPTEPMTAVAVGLTAGPQGLQTRFKSVVLELSEGAAKPLIFAFDKE